MTTQPAHTPDLAHHAPHDAAGDHAALAQRVEAVLFSADRPVATQRIAEAVGLIDPADPADAAPEGTAAKVDKAQRDAALTQIDAAVSTLNDDYARTGRSFRIEKLAGGWRVMTLPAFAPTIAAFQRTRLASRLSRQAVETLAIIAYKQPITRAHLEAIRGVSCGEVLKSLIERRLVTVTGRADELGRPLLYGTTRTFLDQFGLASVADLPTLAELKPIGI
jgi:segregation and condensation protein B